MCDSPHLPVFHPEHPKIRKLLDQDPATLLSKCKNKKKLVEYKVDTRVVLFETEDSTKMNEVAAVGRGVELFQKEFRGVVGVCLFFLPCVETVMCACLCWFWFRNCNRRGEFLLLSNSPFALDVCIFLFGN